MADGPPLLSPRAHARVIRPNVDSSLPTGESYARVLTYQANPLETTTLIRERAKEDPIGMDLMKDGPDRNLVRDVFFGMMRLSTAHHMEVFMDSGKKYNCMALGVQQPITLDNMLELSYRDDGIRHAHVHSCYIYPCVSVAQLRDFRRAEGRRAYAREPALVVEVPTEEWRNSTSTQLLSPRKTQEELANPLYALFPHLLGQQGRATTTTTHDTTAGIAAVPGQMILRVERGTQSPGKRNLPQEVLRFISVEPHESDPPMPIPDDDEEITPAVRQQLEVAFRLLSRIHQTKPGDPVSARPAQLDLKCISASPLVYCCMALGYINRIELRDMMRLYLGGGSLRVRQVYFDFTVIPTASDDLFPGALCMEVVIQQQLLQTAPAQIMERIVPVVIPAAPPIALPSPPPPPPPEHLDEPAQPLATAPPPPKRKAEETTTLVFRPTQLPSASPRVPSIDLTQVAAVATEIAPDAQVDTAGETGPDAKKRRVENVPSAGNEPSTEDPSPAPTAPAHAPAPRPSMMRFLSSVIRDIGW
jgi:hypothetical protein